VITLQSGRTIDLYSLNQERSYAGVLAGLPRKHINDRIIERCRQQAVAKHSQHVIVIDPARKPPPLGVDRYGDQEHGPAEFLPPIVCYGLFRSRPVGNEPEDCSLLLIIWFQAAFALPIDPGVVESIQKVDWEACACNWTD
jgi:hypothetical protein